MTTIVYGGVQVDPARVAEVTAAAREFEARCREEAGNVQYVLSWRVEEPDRIQLLEVWESEQAWEEHKARDHVREWTAFIQQAAVDAPAFSHHEAA